MIKQRREKKKWMAQGRETGRGGKRRGGNERARRNKNKNEQKRANTLRSIKLPLQQRPQSLIVLLFGR